MLYYAPGLFAACSALSWRTYFCIVINNKTICLFTGLHLLFTPHYLSLFLSLSFSPALCLCCYYLKGSGSVTASLELCLPCETAATATSKEHEQRRARGRGCGAWRCLAFTFCGLPNWVINIYLSAGRQHKPWNDLHKLLLKISLLLSCKGLDTPPPPRLQLTQWVGNFWGCAQKYATLR